MRREKSKERPPEDESTDARHRGGTARSREEAPLMVMGVERRGCVVQEVFIDQPEMGGIRDLQSTLRRRCLKLFIKSRVSLCSPCHAAPCPEQSDDYYIRFQ